MFIGVVISSAVLQSISVQFIPVGFRTVPLDGDEWALCLILGAVSIPIGVLVRFLPPFDCINKCFFRGGGGENDNSNVDIMTSVSYKLRSTFRSCSLFYDLTHLNHLHLMVVDTFAQDLVTETSSLLSSSQVNS